MRGIAGFFSEDEGRWYARFARALRGGVFVEVGSWKGRSTSFIGAICNTNGTTFQAWCGDRLCDWVVDEGSVQKASTSQSNAGGIELVATPTVISQTRLGSWAPRSSCIVFTMRADIEPSAQVMMGLDFNHDGTIDYEQPVGVTGFRVTKVEVTAPQVYDGVRFVVAKKGVGRAVLAEVQAKFEETCTAPPVVMRDQSLGTLCGHDSECSSGVCCSSLCAECCSESNGRAPAIPCAAGGVCESRVAFSLRGSFGPAMPLQCSPGGRDRPAGAECVTASDCASGSCEGAAVKAFAIGEDGGLSECAPVLDDGGADEPCVVNAVRGGRCR